jgi:hypothetical protein
VAARLGKQEYFMAEKRKDSDFVVSDRRLFTADGELRSSGENEKNEEPEKPIASSAPASQTSPTVAPGSSTATDGSSGARPASAAAVPIESGASVSSRSSGIIDPDTGDPNVPEPPSASEQKAQQDAYQQSSRDLDRRVELSGHSTKELEVTFERFMASLYVTAMMQLGLMHEQGGQPGVDLLGARQTIDTLSMVSDKTKGNLTPKEQGFLQNCLYELRMAYVEVTNALARPPQAPGSGTGTNG